MATPNYGYEKRQRELAKKKKKEEKVREREQRKLHPESASAAGHEPQNGAPEAGPGAAQGGGANPQ
ncbi:hypothetical protein [Comamonas sp. GB3 AK4-5]|uniref:hypothetical protein n=1 Tax=Comamonas sp. GB3 AK4-5 TaxID=3231487 RepID=UPI00351EF47C